MTKHKVHDNSLNAMSDLFKQVDTQQSFLYSFLNR